MAERQPGAFIQHVAVHIRLDGRTVTAQAPVIDPTAYEPGQAVTVLYDPSRPQWVRLDEERYDAETPALLWAAVLAGGLLPGLMGLWWVRRVRRAARQDAPAFAMWATVAEIRPRRWNRRRRWVTLYPLDAVSDEADVEAIGSYPLMPEVPVRLGARQRAEAKGNVRDGGAVVARIGEVIAWPSARLRR